MKKANFDWQIRSTSPIDSTFKEEMVSQGYSETFAELLWNRNIHTTDDFSQLIKANIDDLHDPFLMHDMDKAVERIQRTIFNKGKQKKLTRFLDLISYSFKVKFNKYDGCSNPVGS